MSSLTRKFSGAEQAGRLVAGSQTSGNGGPDDNDAEASRLVSESRETIVAGALKSSQGTNVDGFPYVSAEKALTMNCHFGDKQGLENQHIDSGGGISLPKLSPTVNAKWQKGTGGPAGDECQNLIAHTLRASHDASEDGTGRGTPLVASGGGRHERHLLPNEFLG